jgi:hypothetical protein
VTIAELEAALVETRARQLFAEHYFNGGGSWDDCWRALPEDDRRHWRALAAAWVAGCDLGALVAGAAEEAADGDDGG